MVQAQHNNYRHSSSLKRKWKGNRSYPFQAIEKSNHVNSLQFHRLQIILCGSRIYLLVSSIFWYQEPVGSWFFPQRHMFINLILFLGFSNLFLIFVSSLILLWLENIHINFPQYHILHVKQMSSDGLFYPHPPYYIFLVVIQYQLFIINLLIQNDLV